MTLKQEEALYEFITTRMEPFTIKDITSFVRSKDSSNFGHLSTDINRILVLQRLAFPVNSNKWITRVGCFTGARFVICPSKDEIENGILIPGHRFLPFGNPILHLKEYKCFWNNIEIPKEDTEASPADLSPYYSVFGDEFLPQLLARENENNEKAYNDMMYDDPAEVSIKTFNLTIFYRTTKFVPGDYIVLTLRDWKQGVFDIEHCPKDAWSEDDLREWKDTAEQGFCKCFELIGTDCSIEEQAAWAYYLGGNRMRNIPAFSLDTFLFDISDKIEMVNFGMEERYWYAGKDIPDWTELHGIQTQSDQSYIEKLLMQYKIPVSEFVIQEYIYDALYQKNTDLQNIVERIVPPIVKMRRWHLEYVSNYCLETISEFEAIYSIFTDKRGAPLREKACELHTAVIELSTRLSKGEFDPSWLPTHTFIILSQIQTHTAAILEDFASDYPLNEIDAVSIESSIDSMIETFDEIKESIENSVQNYRNSNFSLVRIEAPPELTWRVVQISIGGTDVWRRLLVPQAIQLVELHKLIQAIFKWNNLYSYKFSFDIPCKKEFIDKEKNIKQHLTIEDLMNGGYSEINYEYGTRWTIKIIIMEIHNAVSKEHARCVDGENSPPPERVDGPVRFRRLVNALNSSVEKERHEAHLHLGFDFNSKRFEITECNKSIETLQLSHKNER